MKTRCLKTNFSLAGALLATPLVFSGVVKAGAPEDYTFTSFDLPDQTYVFGGLNNHGQVVGTAGADPGLGRCPLSSGSAVFLLSDGVYTILPYPDPETDGIWATGMRGMCATAINDSGVVVGRFFADALIGLGGFKYSNGVYEVIAPAGTYFTWTSPDGISDSGQVVGSFSDSDPPPGGTTRTQGFIESNGVYTILAGPTPTTYYDFAGGINDEGQVVGAYQDDEHSSGGSYFRSSGGVYDTNLFPAVPEVGFDNLMPAYPIGINDSGAVLASFRSGCITKVFSEGQYTPIIHPDDLSSSNTCSYGINDHGQVVGNYYDGTVRHGFIATPVEGPPNHIAHPDFDDDGKADILWRNGSTGQNRMYLMDGATIATNASVNTLSTVWQAVGNGDYNGDGKADILWRNSSMGRNWMYLMNGATVATSAGVNTVSTVWQVVGNGDYNGDGKADILWRNSSTGRNWMYLMNGATIATSAGVNTLSTVWQVVGNGDYNGDGKADILWRNSSTGQNRMYLMNGAAIATDASVNTLSTVWQVVGNGDYNGDGKADILWRNSSTGRNWMYLMNGATVATSAGVNTLSTVWQVVGNGDYNGDGKADILWRNSSTGRNWMYLMNGATIATSAGVNTLSTVWQVVNVD